MVESTSPPSLQRPQLVLLPTLFDHVQENQDSEGLVALLGRNAARLESGKSPMYHSQAERYFSGAKMHADLNLALVLYLAGMGDKGFDAETTELSQMDFSRLDRQWSGMAEKSGARDSNVRTYGTHEYGALELSNPAGVFVAARQSAVGDVAYSLVVVNRGGEKQAADAFLVVIEEGFFRMSRAARWEGVDAKGVPVTWRGTDTNGNDMEWQGLGVNGLRKQLDDTTRRLEFGMRSSWNVPPSRLYRALEQVPLSVYVAANQPKPALHKA